MYKLRRTALACHTVRPPPGPGQRLPRRAVVGRSDVEKRTHALGPEDDAAAVLIGLDQVLDPGRGQKLFQAQGLFEFLGHIEQGQLLVSEMVRLTTHAYDS